MTGEYITILSPPFLPLFFPSKIPHFLPDPFFESSFFPRFFFIIYGFSFHPLRSKNLGPVEHDSNSESWNETRDRFIYNNNNKLVSRKSWNTRRVFRVRCVTLSSGGRVFSSNITHKSVSVREESDTRALSLSLFLSITAINHNESLLPLGWGGMCFHDPRGVASSPSSPVARLFRARRLYNSISSPRHPSNSVSSFSWISRAVSARAKPGNGHARFNIIDAIRFDSIRFDRWRDGGRRRKEGAQRNDEERMKGGRGGLRGDFRILSGGLDRCIVCKTGGGRMEESGQRWKGDAGV